MTPLPNGWMNRLVEQIIGLFCAKIDVGFDRPEVFVAGPRSQPWVAGHVLAIKAAMEFLNRCGDTSFRHHVVRSISRVTIAAVGTDKYSTGRKAVLLACEPGVTDNPLYLASRLIHVAILIGRHDEDVTIVREDAYKHQLAFLSKFPEGESIRRAIAKVRRRSAISTPGSDHIE